MAGSESLRELIEKAREAQEYVLLGSTVGLEFALDAGDALRALKAMVGPREWSSVLTRCGIPLSTARFYMKLARNRDRISAADCGSIREAGRLVDGSGNGRSARTDRYSDGYADGYRAGQADPGDVDPPSERDLKWLISLAHPDRHLEGRHATKATRVTGWLNDRLARTRSTNG